MIYKVGYSIGKIKVIGKQRDNNSYKELAIIRCQCGRVYKTYWNNIKLLKGKGCAYCIGDSRKTHGLTDSRLYGVWEDMKSRCSGNGDLNHKKNYYNRGIRVCDEWEKFENFYNWAIENGYKEDLYESGRNKVTIDRINNDGNYEPSNCRFITHQENQYNKRTTIYVDYNGNKENLLELSNHIHLNKKTLYTRIKRGKNIDDPYIEKKDPKYLYNGEELTLGEIAKNNNMSVKFLRGRIRMGWTIEEAVKTPKLKMNRNINLYKYNGDYYCISDLAKLLGLKRTTLQYRIKNGIVNLERKGV